MEQQEGDITQNISSRGQNMSASFFFLLLIWQIWCLENLAIVVLKHLKSWWREKCSKEKQPHNFSSCSSCSAAEHSLSQSQQDLLQRDRLRQVYKNLYTKSEDESPSWWWDNFSSGLTATLPIRQTAGNDKNSSLELRVTHQQSIIRPITFAILSYLSPRFCTLRLF